MPAIFAPGGGAREPRLCTVSASPTGQFESGQSRAISALIPHVRRGSPVVFGDVFGGRIDNIHTVTAAKALGDPEGSPDKRIADYRTEYTGAWPRGQFRRSG